MCLVELQSKVEPGKCVCRLIEAIRNQMRGGVTSENVYRNASQFTFLFNKCRIIPQAICTRYGLLIGSVMAPVVKGLVLLLLPISWPISKLLDCLLGTKHSTFYRRSGRTLCE